MADVPREKLTYTQLRDDSCLKQLAINTAYGLGGGLLAAGVQFTLKYPDLANKPSGAIFRGLAYNWVPGLTAGAISFTAVACGLESNRGVKDEWNSAAGGFAAGLVYGAIKYRSPVAPFVIGLLSAGVTSGTDVWERLSPSVEELAPKRDPHDTIVPRPVDLAMSVRASDVSGKLLRS